MSQWNNLAQGDSSMQNQNNGNEFASIVTMKDVAKVGKMNKDQLRAWTNQPCTFNYVIDTTRSMSNLRNQVTGMIKVRLGKEIEKKIKNGENVDGVDAKELSLGYLFNPANRRVFVATTALLKRQDFIPCDKEGNRI